MTTELHSGKCWGCGNYVFHYPDCPTLVAGASKYLKKIRYQLFDFVKKSLEKA